MKCILFVVCVLGLSLSGCASKEMKPQEISALDKKIQAEPPADTPQAIAERGAQAFINAPGLTDDQKRKVMSIYLRVYNEAMAIRKEIGQMKSLLFKLIATHNYKAKEVEAIRMKIVEADQHRLQIMFKALEDVQNAIGTGPNREEIWKHFYDFEYPRYDRLSEVH